MIEFTRLTQIPAAEVMGQLDEPRNGRHMPLAGQFSDEGANRLARDKDDQGAAHVDLGLG